MRLNRLAVLNGATAIGLAFAFGLAEGASAAEWQVPLAVTNGSSQCDTIGFGVHPAATPGIDPGLGEVELPPWPPSALFEVRFAIPETNGLNLDLRDTTHTQRFHTIKWQAGDGGYPITVKWNRTALPCAALYISDGYGGVFIPPISMYEADSLVIPVSQAFIKLLTLAVTPGASPGAGPEISDIPGSQIFRGQRFPDYSLDAYVFDPDTPDHLLQWFVTGNLVLVFTIDNDRVLHIEAPEGWTGTETVTFTVRDPEDRIDQTSSTFGVVGSGPQPWEVPLTVTNGAEQGRTTYFGIDPDGTDGIDSELGEIELPPWPPSQAFDARMRLPNGFTYSIRDIRGNSADTIAYHVCWQAGSGGYPITVKWVPDLPLGDFFISDEMGGVFIPPTNMRDTSQVVVPGTQQFITGLRIAAVAVIDTTRPAGPDSLWVIHWNGANMVTLGWSSCAEAHFGYYEILYDTEYFTTNAGFSWDWSEDSALSQIATVTTLVALPGLADYHMFRIRAWDLFGNVGEVSNLVSVPDCSGVPDQDSGYSSESQIVRISPNPVRGQASIYFYSPTYSQTFIGVYNISGREIRKLVVSPSQYGEGVAVWNGCDSAGESVTAGVYFLRLGAGRGHATRKIVVLE